MNEIKELDEVIIKASKEKAYVVEIIDNDDGTKSYMLDIKSHDELPVFYERDEFDLVETTTGI